MRPQNQPPPERAFTQADGFNLLYVFISALACCGWPFTRHRFGTGAYFPFGYVACLLMFCYARFGECPQAMACFAAAWISLVFYHRGCTLARAWQGDHEHSLYDGYPWLVSRLFGISPRHELAAKFCAEPLLLLLAAGVVALASPSLGLFIAAVAAAVVIRVAIGHLVELAFDRSQRDAEITLRQRVRRRGG